MYTISLNSASGTPIAQTAPKRTSALFHFLRALFLVFIFLAAFYCALPRFKPDSSASVLSSTSQTLVKIFQDSSALPVSELNVKQTNVVEGWGKRRILMVCAVLVVVLAAVAAVVWLVAEGAGSKSAAIVQLEEQSSLAEENESASGLSKPNRGLVGLGLAVLALVFGCLFLPKYVSKIKPTVLSPPNVIKPASNPLVALNINQTDNLGLHPGTSLYSRDELEKLAFDNCSRFSINHNYGCMCTASSDQQSDYPIKVPILTSAKFNGNCSYVYCKPGYSAASVPPQYYVGDHLIDFGSLKGQKVLVSFPLERGQRSEYYVRALDALNLIYSSDMKRRNINPFLVATVSAEVEQSATELADFLYEFNLRNH